MDRLGGEARSHGNNAKKLHSSVLTRHVLAYNGEDSHRQGCGENGEDYE